MADTCIITRTGLRTLDESSLAMTGTPSAVYTGVFRLDPTSAGGEPQHSTVDAGERQVFRQVRTGRVPADAGGIEVGDVLTVTSSGQDDDLPGRAFQVLAVEHGTHLTARRLTLQERTT